MGQAPRHLTPSSSLLHYFGAEVRQLREDKCLSAAELGRLVLHSADLVRRIELAERMPSQDFVSRCDDALDAGGSLLRLWPLLDRERRLRLDRCSARESYNPALYDRPVLDWLLAPRMEPQTKPSGEPLVKRAQRDLRELRSLDHRRGGGETYPKVVTALNRDIGALTSTAPAVAVGFLELAGYEAVDLGADGRAQAHYLQALEIVSRAGDRQLGGYLIAVSLAHLSLHCGDAGNVVRLVTAAIRGMDHEGAPTVRAACELVLARAYARLGDEPACTAALHRAERNLDHPGRGNEPEWIAYLGQADLADGMAHCFFDLDRHADAQACAALAIELAGPGRRRRLAIDSALLASSLARTGDVEQACMVGRQAIDHAAATLSFRGAHRIMLMMAELHRYLDVPTVRDLAEYLKLRMPTIPTLLATDLDR
ncbi:helix-turn-helix domain-containing protein [Catellatospora chokoriensis]|uniref:Helix-turn-helix protein n=1 Tax=Catellatospora chokoriensis TaxID=310353 RepID=A0A8J3K148_9ACTN|nr:helix-turn-helix transcriptional regulator [Catellatospora chokoriensis]GIF94791.1 hypothetical protein Cch02nite_82350 [Catellatospora chokoriensis]